MKVTHDKSGQPMIEWKQYGDGWKRAWIQRKQDESKNWAKVERYLNVVRTTGPDTGIAGNLRIFQSSPMSFQMNRYLWPLFMQFRQSQVASSIELAL